MSPDAEELLNLRKALAIARAKGEHYPTCDRPPRGLAWGSHEHDEWHKAHRPRGGAMPFCDCWKAAMEHAARGES